MIYPANFFGLTVYPGKAYSTILEDDTHLTMAALTSEVPGKDTGRTSLILTIDGNSFTLCSLTPGKLENQPIDIYLSQDDEITFTVKGSCPVDLTGNVVAIISPEDDLLEEEMMDGELVDEEIDSDEASILDMDELDEDGVPVNVDIADESDEEELTDAELAILKKKLKEAGDAEDVEFSSDLEGDDEDMESGSDDQDEDSEGSDDEVAMEFDAALIAELNKRKMTTQPIPRNDKKAKITEIVEEPEKTKKNKKESKKDSPAPAKEESKKEVKKGPKEESKKEIKKPATEKKDTPAEKKDTPAEKKAPADAPKTDSNEPLKKTLPSGLVIEDEVVGTGPRAKSGQKVQVRYIGKLANGKVFDSNTKGAPFSFKLGKGQVIKGWDMGVQGMNVGGTRKLTIPAPLAYGKQGAAPDIPKNATLQFEVKLLSIK